MKTLNASTDLFEPVELNLWGSKYSLLEPTRKVEKAVETAQKVVDDLSDDAPEEEQFAAIVGVVDEMLEPLPDEAGKKPPRAKTVLKGLFKQEKIGAGHVIKLMDALAEARTERPI